MRLRIPSLPKGGNILCGVILAYEIFLSYSELDNVPRHPTRAWSVVVKYYTKPSCDNPRNGYLGTYSQFLDTVGEEARGLSLTVPLWSNR